MIINENETPHIITDPDNVMINEYESVHSVTEVLSSSEEVEQENSVQLRNEEAKILCQLEIYKAKLNKFHLDHSKQNSIHEKTHSFFEQPIPSTSSSSGNQFPYVVKKKKLESKLITDSSR